MKKLIAVASALVLVTSLVAAADSTTATKSAKEKSEKSEKSAKKDDKSKSDRDGKSESSAAGHSATGKVTAWDNATKQFTVADSKGKKWSFAWNTKTKLDKAPKVGDQVKVKYTADKAGKNWATQIHAASTKKATASPASNQ